MKNKGGKIGLVFIVLIAILCLAGMLVYTFLRGGEAPAAASGGSAYVPTENALANGTTDIVLSDEGSTISGSGAVLSGDTIKITGAGTYHISGTLSDGQIYVDVGNRKSVVLVLDGVDLTNTKDAAIYVENSGECSLYLTEGTENVITSGTKVEITAEASDVNASGGAITFKDDATISGTGSLTVYGYINNGIHCSNNLFIESGTLTVSAVNKAVKGKDSLTINGGLITVAESYEGMEGEIMTINDGEISITSLDDAMNASDSDNTSLSMPNLTINGGTIYANASGDGLDSNGDLVIAGGTIIVDGPSNAGNGSLDSGMEQGGKILINGGTLFAIGANGMVETPDAESSQNVFSLNVDYVAGDVISIQDAAGNTLFTYTAVKDGGNVIFSSAALAIGETYTVSVNENTSEISLTDVVSGDIGSGMGMGGQMGGMPGGHANFGGDPRNGTAEGQMPEGANGTPPAMPENDDGSRPEMPENADGSGPEMTENTDG